MESRCSLMEPLESRQLMSGTIVRLATSVGNIDIQLLDQQTPQSTTNFLNYVNSNRYNGTFFNRSLPGFVIQGGGYAITSPLGPLITQDAAVTNEPHGGNVRGTVGLAKQPGNPNSGGSQFFINLADNSQNLDNQNGGFTVFGQVVDGTLGVADKIAKYPTYTYPGFDSLSNLPLKDYTLPNQIQPSNYLSINSAMVVQTTDVTVAAGKVVTFTDVDGTTSTVTITGAGGVLHFSGTQVSKTATAKGFTVIGSAVSLDSITLSGQSAKAIVNINAKGGDGTATVGQISSKGSGSLTVNSTGAALSIATLALTGSTVKTAVNVARVGKGTVEVDDITATGAVGSISGAINLVGLVTAVGSVKTLSATTVGADIVTGKIGGQMLNLTAGSLTNSNITAAAGIATMKVTGTMRGSTVNTPVGIGTLTAGTITASKICAGVKALPTNATASHPNGADLPVSKSDFSGNATIKSINAKVFSNSEIAASTITAASLGKVTLSNGGTPFGIGAKKITSLMFNQTKLVNLNSAAIVASKHLSTGDFKIVVV